MKKQDKTHYLTARESRRVAAENARQIAELEARKKRHVAESEYTAHMQDDGNILEIDDLHTYFFTDSGVVKSVNGVTYSIPKNSVVGVVGESGCGKSVTALSVMQLLQAPQGQIVSGSIRFRASSYKKDAAGKFIPRLVKNPDGTDATEIVTLKNGKTETRPVYERDEDGYIRYETEEKVYDIAQMPLSEMRKLRGREIAMIFQEPMTSLNPVFTIGNQLDEVVLCHVPDATREQARAKSIEMLTLTGIAMPEQVYEKYPYELSGGMRQRVMIAMVLACNPRLIIADEPTTALDVTIQAQILDLLRKAKQKTGGSVMLITHDLGVIAEMADYVVVMYAGRVIETGTVYEIYENPLHPYTIGLQKSRPSIDDDGAELYCIPGSVPNPIDMPDFCFFRDRCNMRCEACTGKYPGYVQVSPTHRVACWRYAGKES